LLTVLGGGSVREATFIEVDEFFETACGFEKGFDSRLGLGIVGGVVEQATKRGHGRFMEISRSMHMCECAECGDEGVAVVGQVAFAQSLFEVFDEGIEVWQKTGPRLLIGQDVDEELSSVEVLSVELERGVAGGACIVEMVEIAPKVGSGDPSICSEIGFVEGFSALCGPAQSANGAVEVTSQAPGFSNAAPGVVILRIVIDQEVVVVEGGIEITDMVTQEGCEAVCQGGPGRGCYGEMSQSLEDFDAEARLLGVIVKAVEMFEDQARVGA